MEAKITIITPELAKKFLGKNSNNYRKLSEKVVRSYQIDMETGNWKFNGDSIKFNKSGQLVDGQHRLTAILRSGVSIPMVVITEISDDVNTYDVGKGRTVSDVAKADGLCAGASNPTTVGAVALLLRGAFGSASCPKQKVISIISAEEDVWANAYYAATKGGAKHPIAKKSPCVLAAYTLIKQNCNYNDLCEFFSIVNSGFSVGGKECSPAIVLRNYLVSEKAKLEINTHQGRTYLFSATLSAYRDFDSGSVRRNAYKTDASHASLMKDMREFAIGK